MMRKRHHAEGSRGRTAVTQNPSRMQNVGTMSFSAKREAAGKLKGGAMTCSRGMVAERGAVSPGRRNWTVRVSPGFAARIASALVGGFFGCGAFLCSPTAGIKGSTCVGMIEPRSMGCVLIGPIGVGLPLGMLRSR